MTSPLRIIHTSDWHLGRMLYNKKRYEEHEQFLDWLAATMEERRAKVLLVAGDIFDTTTPTVRAQELYYKFLCRISEAHCRHVIITAGNHDSAAFLDAPRSLLKYLHIHVVGNCSPDNPEEEILVLRDKAGAPELIVCAVPFLRDRDMRKAEAGESIEDKEIKLTAGIRDHYAAIARGLERIRGELGADIPAICMGHLFAAGARTVPDDGVRNLYVGTLADITADIFSPDFDYVALGHLHVAQTVGGQERIRYSGSPIPMGFREASRQKIVCEIEFDCRKMTINSLKVPVFQKMLAIKGDEDTITRQVTELASSGENNGTWLEILYTGSESAENLRARLEKLLENTGMEIARLKDERILNRILRQSSACETLRDLDEEEIFSKLLEEKNIEPEKRIELMATYREALLCYRNNDEDENLR